MNDPFGANKTPILWNQIFPLLWNLKPSVAVAVKKAYCIAFLVSLLTIITPATKAGKEILRCLRGTS